MPKIYSIPSSLAFADALAEGLMKRVDYNPQALASYRILLPTRRACRTLRDAFLRLGNGKLMLLPKLEAIGDPDEDELNILSGAQTIHDTADIPPSINPLARLGLLSGLIKKNPAFTGTDKQALNQAKTLMRFLDELYIEDKNLDDLKSLVDDSSLAHHWQITLDFLDVLKNDWPQLLSKHHVIDPVDRRNRLIRMQAKIWSKTPPEGPVIAAGLTGSVPATIALLQSILKMEQGEVLLPGLDQSLDSDSWDLVDEEHPQYAFKKLLHNLNLNRQHVSLWPSLINKGEPQREKLLSEVMRPAEKTTQWRTEKVHAKAVENLHLIECENYHEESSVIALIMREALERPGKRVALVTPDRLLAMRVKEKLRRWNIEVDDSAGQILGKTKPAVFLILLLKMLHQQFRPIAVLSFMKHAFFGNVVLPDARQKTRQLDLALRGVYKRAGLNALVDRIAQKDEKLLTELQPFFDCLNPLLTTAEKGKAPLKDWVEAHLSVAEKLASTAELEGSQRLWKEEAGEALSSLFSQIIDQSAQYPMLDMEGYQTLLEHLMGEITIRPLYGVHPRLFILGLMESRLYQADLMVLASLNEDSWPPEAKNDLWMSRPMRKEFGLPSPEQRIGFSAHDFAENAAAPNVIMTRSRLVDSVPQLPSRWLQRLFAILHANNLTLENIDHYKNWAGQLDAAEGEITPVSRPAPTPPKSARPRELYVTDIERWMKDPYALYAKKILNLRKLDDLEKEEDTALRGQIIHDALFHFVETYAHELPQAPDDPKEVLMSFIERALEEENLKPADVLSWMPRFDNIADWFVRFEAARRAEGYSPEKLETRGAYTHIIDGAEFKIEAKADRLDKDKNNAVTIIDYKTGTPPSKTDVYSGFAPQLALEAIIANKGRFDTLSKAQIAAIEFWKLSGNEKTTAEVRQIKIDDMDAFIEDTLKGFEELVRVFDLETTPYLSLPNENKSPREAFQDYAYLARTKEWSNETEDVA